jgi:hypothetical protein
MWPRAVRPSKLRSALPQLTGLNKVPFSARSCATTRRSRHRSLDRFGETAEVACAIADPAFGRVNLEIVGNTGAFLHARVWPRYD